MRIVPFNTNPHESEKHEKQCCTDNVMMLQGVAVNDQKDVRTCNFGGKFFSRNDFFPGKTVKNENR
jgi:hypothetical protein